MSKTNAEHQRDFRARMTTEERKIYDQQRYLRSRGKYKVRAKEWQKNNPEHAQASTHQSQVKKKYPEAYNTGNITTQGLREWLKEYRGRLCKYCDEPGTHIDHIVPLSRGGEHTFLNIQITCEFCNMAKNNLSEIKFLRKCRDIFYNCEELY